MVFHGFGDDRPGDNVIRRGEFQYPASFAKLGDLERHGAFKRVKQHQHIVPEARLLSEVRSADGYAEG